MENDKIIELVNTDIYQYENQIFSGVNLSVFHGEFIYVVGKVGMGKTSLIKTLNGELPLISGVGMVAGFELSNLRNKDVALLRRKLGVVFQDFRLLTDRNVYENLSFVLKATGWTNKKEINERIQEVLESVGVAAKSTKMPYQLSGGEQQRVVIAKAILNHPLLLLADEPTGNLDPETSEEILNLFIGLNNQKITVLLASHDYAVLSKKPARTLVCTEGRITDSADNNTIIDFKELLEESV